MTDEEKALNEQEPAQAADMGEDVNDFAKALTVPKPGDVVTGKVVQVSPDSVMVDVGYKSEGIIPLNELSHRPMQSADQVVSVGDEIKVYVVSVDGHEGGLKLSKRKADEQAAWGRVQESFEKGEVLEAEVVEVVKGGLVVDIGLRGFMPASQVERGYVADLGKYLGQKVRARIIEMDRHKNRVILSRKSVLEEERKAARERLWAELEEGQVREGTVKSLTDFGAFVDLGGVDGLVHVSELSYGRVKHPSEVLSEGQQVKVKVLRLDREKGKVSLGYKQTLPDPWQVAVEKYAEGSTVTGKVVRLTTFGAFVELEPGIDGLIHISQLADQHVNNPNEVVNPGQEVRVKVLSVKPEEKRISLSLREAEQG
ncbi:MAG: 30S ribosomal protein S1 [Bacillota bacterium]